MRKESRAQWFFSQRLDEFGVELGKELKKKFSSVVMFFEDLTRKLWKCVSSANHITCASASARSLLREQESRTKTKINCNFIRYDTRKKAARNEISRTVVKSWALSALSTLECKLYFDWKLHSSSCCFNCDCDTGRDWQKNGSSAKKSLPKGLHSDIWRCAGRLALSLPRAQI